MFLNLGPTGSDIPSRQVNEVDATPRTIKQSGRYDGKRDPAPNLLIIPRPNRLPISCGTPDNERMNPLQPRRRLLQFGLRTLFLLTTVCAVWFGIHVHRMREQKEAVKAIRNFGGWVFYDFQETLSGSGKFDVRTEPSLPPWLVSAFGEDFFYDISEVNLVYSNDSGKRQENANFSDDALRHLSAFPNLRFLLICNGQATDDGLNYVGRLRKLEGLYMWHASEVTDAGVAHLSELTKLKKIHLDGSKISDESLRVLSRLPSLEEWSLQKNCFTDRGLSYLANNTMIRQLCVGLGGSDITDAGTTSLRGLVKLELLDLQGTKVTAKGLDNLKTLAKLKNLWLSGTTADSSLLEQALPNCKITR